MRFAVVDDEPRFLKKIPMLIKQFLPDMIIDIDLFSSPSTFLTTYTEQKYDVLFLDINMPNMNGFELSKDIRNQNDCVPIVYISAMDNLMIQAFRYKALGFVRKQFIESDLLFALSTILSEFRINNDTIEVKETRSHGGHTCFISIEQIMYIESECHNVTINMIDGRKITVRKPISYFVKHESFQHFIAISSGIIVNLSLIELTENAVSFPNGDKLFISRRKIPSVRMAYLNNLKKAKI